MLNSIIFGIVAGASLPGALGYFLLHYLARFGNEASLIGAGVCAVLGCVYSVIAINSSVYESGDALSMLGYFLDITWSLLNSVVGLFIWAPLCLLVGGTFVEPNSESKRSGTFVFDKNPRGSDYDTTIGTVIAGKWSTHEEVHVWQARIFGPVYLVTYGIALVLNFVFRFILLRFATIGFEAYRRVFWEDWAYAAGSASGSADPLNWGSWVLGLLRALLYVGFVLAIAIGLSLHTTLMLLIGTAGLILFTLIRMLMA